MEDQFHSHPYPGATAFNSPKNNITRNENNMNESNGNHHQMEGRALAFASNFSNGISAPSCVKHDEKIDKIVPSSFKMVMMICCCIFLLIIFAIYGMATRPTDQSSRVERCSIDEAPTSTMCLDPFYFKRRRILEPLNFSTEPFEPSLLNTDDDYCSLSDKPNVTMCYVELHELPRTVGIRTYGTTLEICLMLDFAYESIKLMPVIPCVVYHQFKYPNVDTVYPFPSRHAELICCAIYIVTVAVLYIAAYYYIMVVLFGKQMYYLLKELADLYNPKYYNY